MKKVKRRPYRLQSRAKKQAATHEKLARAAFELHSTIGPAQTTVTAIAERAGVQRLTVYRHFPDQGAIFAACSAYSFADDPPPDPEAWRELPPEIRLRDALAQLYGYYRRKRRLLTNLHRDAAIPVVADALARRRGTLEKAASIILESMGGGSAAKADRLLVASVRHALEFTTWQSLAESHGLSDEEVVEVMLNLFKALTANRQVRTTTRRRARDTRS